MKPKQTFAAHYDAIVVGARCAGASTAMLLARQGARVLVVDWAEPGSDTMSTHALMRGAVMQLNRWGVLDTIVAAGTPAIRTTTFQYGDSVVPLAIKPSHGVDALYAPRRTVLDRALIDAARQAGADVRFGVSFKDVIRDPQGRVVGALLGPIDSKVQEVRADIIIGADGRRSSVARRVDARTQCQARNSIACVFAYFDGIRDTGTRWLYGAGTGAGKIPTNDGQHCIFAAMSQERFQTDIRVGQVADPLQAVLDEIDPAFGAQVALGQRRSNAQTFAGHKGYIRKSWGPGWALVGDAAYFKDPLTAHGITDALRDAEGLANAVSAGTYQALETYQRNRDGLSHDLFEISDEIAGMQWSFSELQALHMKLNAALSAEQDWIIDNYDVTALAA
ncbi:MAG: NAD(P)/FAD-dependent oxidoreductase [Paracoccaceae bacterium]